MAHLASCKNLRFESAPAKDADGTEFYVVCSFLPHDAGKEEAEAICKKLNKLMNKTAAKKSDGPVEEVDRFKVVRSQNKNCYAVQSTVAFTPEDKWKAFAFANNMTMVCGDRSITRQEIEFRQRSGGDHDDYLRRN